MNTTTFDNTNANDTNKASSRVRTIRIHRLLPGAVRLALAGGGARSRRRGRGGASCVCHVYCVLLCVRCFRCVYHVCIVLCIVIIMCVCI